MLPKAATIISGDDDEPVGPADRSLAYLTSIGPSPNTVKAYAHDLKDLLVFLADRGLDRRVGHSRSAWDSAR